MSAATSTSPMFGMALGPPPSLRVKTKKSSEDIITPDRVSPLPHEDVSGVEHHDWSSSADNDDARPSKRLSTGSNQDDQVLKGLEPDCLIKEEDEELCKSMESWKPFVDKVANYMMVERLPFEYFDVWVPVVDASGKENASAGEQDDSSHSSSSSQEEPDAVKSSTTDALSCSGNSHTSSNSGSTNENALRLRHVGHGTNDAAELSCIFTMYQMNQFGNCSEKYSFPPGVGLPGRVFRSNQPMWDNALQQAPFRDFPRTQLAKRFGLKQGLAIPLALTEDKHVIIAMYATNFVERNDEMVQHAASALREDPAAIPRPLPNPEDEEDDKTSSEQDAPVPQESILPDDTEVEMAQMLVRYYNSGQTDCFPLVCLLWRAPCNRTPSQHENLQQLKGIFLKGKQQQQDKEDGDFSSSEDDVAANLVKEWDSLQRQL